MSSHTPKRPSKNSEIIGLSDINRCRRIAVSLLDNWYVERASAEVHRPLSSRLRGLLGIPGAPEHDSLLTSICDVVLVLSCRYFYPMAWRSIWVCEFVGRPLCKVSNVKHSPLGRVNCCAIGYDLVRFRGFCASGTWLVIVGGSASRTIVRVVAINQQIRSLDKVEYIIGGESIETDAYFGAVTGEDSVLLVSGFDDGVLPASGITEEVGELRTPDADPL